MSLNRAIELTPALASQSLSVIVALIPYIREFIRRHLNPKQAVMLTEFDKLKRVGVSPLQAAEPRTIKSTRMKFMRS